MPLRLVYLRKCVLCSKILPKHETDLCRACRTQVPLLEKPKRTIPFVARWTALWYYKDTVRRSILRFKYYYAFTHGLTYGRLLAMKLTQEMDVDFDLVTWVPSNPWRIFLRSNNQSKRLALALSKELGLECQKLLRKTRLNDSQSGIPEETRRKANVLGAFAVTDPARVAGKKILLVDDIVTTGATCSECAKTLLIAGAKEVSCAAVAASHPKK